MNDILVTVITCLYNTPPDLFDECLKGLVNQSFKNFEVLIVNDGSDKYLDENKNLINKYKDNRFKYFDKVHDGKSQTLNYALKLAKGKYIAINDADDVSYPNRLEYQYNFLENNPEYDAISNTMKGNPSNVIFPGCFPSSKVEWFEVHYKCMHPIMMLNKDKVLSSVPFLFEQIYDGMEDTVFNYIMYFCGGLNFYYDNKVLLEYSQKNPNAIHWTNLVGYRKEGAFKLFHRTFYPKDIHEEPNMTCILLVNNMWKEELEKTIINIRFTSNNVKILIIGYGCFISLLQYKKYNVQIKNVKDYIEAFNLGIELCDTDYLMMISKPIRFYNHNWDLYAIRNFKFIWRYHFVQPYMTGIDKLDRDNYYNENGKIENYKVRCGKNLVLLSDEMTEDREKLDFYSEYSTTADIPIIDEDLIFLTSKQNLLEIQGAQGFSSNLLLNVYLSIKEYLNDKWIYIDKDIECGVVNNIPIPILNKESYEYNYYLSMWKIAYFFLNENKFIYEKILKEKIGIEETKSIIESVAYDENFNSLICNFPFKYDMSYFLKNINAKWITWDTTNAI